MRGPWPLTISGASPALRAAAAFLVRAARLSKHRVSAVYRVLPLDAVLVRAGMCACPPVPSLAMARDCDATTRPPRPQGPPQSEVPWGTCADRTGAAAPWTRAGSRHVSRGSVVNYSLSVFAISGLCRGFIYLFCYYYYREK